MNRFRYAFTVFTAVFNRGHTLGRVYRSLAAQTFADFEWLIVDDGSTEDIPALIRPWQAEARFPIRYVFQENAGKHIAFNAAVGLAEGAFFVPLDSDDGCTPDALERLEHHWESIPPAERDRFSGVSCLCVDQHGALVGSRFPAEPLDSDWLELRYRFGVRGEKWGFQRTEVLERFPFPEEIRGTYVPEGIVWSRIARRYKLRCVNEALRIFWIEGVSQGSGGDPARNARGRRLAHLIALNEEVDWLPVGPAHLARSAVNYSRNSFHLGFPLRDQAAAITTPAGVTLWALGLPIGYLAYQLGRAGVLRG